MGAEQLEESVSSSDVSRICAAPLSGKPVGLFGSYGWGDGEWDRTWADGCSGCRRPTGGCPVMANGAPDGDATDACNALGTALANA